MAISLVDSLCPMLFSPEYQEEHHRTDFQRGDLAQSMEHPVRPQRVLAKTVHVDGSWSATSDRFK